MAEFASKGVAGTALGLGAGALGVELLRGGLGGLLGGRTSSDNVSDMAAMLAALAPALAGGKQADCGGHSYGRYDAEKDAEIARLETENKLLKANTYTDQKSLELYQYIDGRLRGVEGQIAAQAVTNQKTQDSFALAAADLSAVKSNLEGQIKLEAERRCCADNAIVNYANATFYSKQVADVTVGATTTAQTLYNPIPDCGGGCCGK